MCFLLLSCAVLYALLQSVCRQKVLATGFPCGHNGTACNAAMLLTASCFCCPQIYTAEEKQALALDNFAAQKEKEAKVLSDLKVGMCLLPLTGADVASVACHAVSSLVHCSERIGRWVHSCAVQSLVERSMDNPDDPATAAAAAAAKP